jgi:hypothetical protein
MNDVHLGKNAPKPGCRCEPLHDRIAVEIGTCSAFQTIRQALLPPIYLPLDSKSRVDVLLTIILPGWAYSRETASICVRRTRYVVQGVSKSVQTEREEEEVGFRDERRGAPEAGRHGSAIFFENGVNEVSMYGWGPPV